MTGYFKFVRSKDRIYSYAEARVEASLSSYLTVTWAADLHTLEKIYGDAVLEGVQIAHEAHIAAGGAAAAFSVLEFKELVVDTKPDAASCAAAAAAWIALGHDVADVEFVFSERWVPLIKQRASGHA